MMFRYTLLSLTLAATIQTTMAALPSCASQNVSALSFLEDCTALCTPFGIEVTDQVSTTDDNVAKIMKCECSDGSTGCSDEIVLLDKTIPLTTCDAIGIERIDQCRTACQELGQSSDVFRDTNGLTVCSCKNTDDVSSDLCSDKPSCEQLRIFPTMVEEGCTSFCPEGSVVQFEDRIQYAGGPQNANRDFTTLFIDCRCNGVVACDDNILFSDLVNLEGCLSEFGIVKESDCEDYCNENGFTTDFEFTGTAGKGNCTCFTDEGSAVACVDDFEFDLSDAFGNGNSNGDSGAFSSSVFGGNVLLVAWMSAFGLFTLMI